MKFPAKFVRWLYTRLPAVYLTRRSVYMVLALVGLFLFGFAWPWLVPVGQLVLAGLVLAVVVEFTLLYSQPQPLTASRITEDKLSNGDYNPVIIRLSSRYPFRTRVVAIDEFPVQLQLRNRHFDLGLCPAGFRREVTYEIRPVRRGEYAFGDIRVLVSTRLGLLQRRLTLPAATVVPVYPSFIQLRKYAFFTIHNRLDELGIKRIRKLGANNEFEQIREYVQGDDFRRINWKATARRRELMVNQYQEERAQQVYCLLDTGRHMQMPFDGLTLVEYAVNATLVMLGVAAARGDKPGLLVFSRKVDYFLPAHGKSGQLSLIAKGLYKAAPNTWEPDFLRLYKQVKMHIRKRSLLLLFTNFDTISGMKRQMPYLQALARHHLLCVVFFENTGISKVARTPAFGLGQAYEQTIAEKYELEKRLIVAELNKAGIYSILTPPADLTVNTINKYIYFKARGAI